MPSAIASPPDKDDHLSRLRRAEFSVVATRLNGASRVLEIGGGNGFQKTLLSAVADEVLSFDISAHPAPVAAVDLYDGVRLPLEDGSVDAVFSSNVLEHIEDLGRALADQRRVLADGGIAVHVLPTSAWRFWTSVLHYPALIKKLALRMFACSPQKSTVGQAADDARSTARRIADVIVSTRHGERGNRFTEVYYFRKRWWRETFASSGWQVTHCYPAGVVYTGHALLGDCLSINTRRGFARFLGSATRVYVLKKSD